ncbi:galactonate dehydratase [Halorhabdus amylolytica]|uniref:galactonate dehydratase n=1 Tax=Halorhabdus amylolytica TaxID=2559573 RepID=UPI0010AA5255|nr:galactonate dehydratase [Halorhabdus amylolytica]
MKIVDYELYNVPPRWVFLKLITDEGIVGWGEPVTEGNSRASSAAVADIVEMYLMGKDPLEINRHWQAMYRGKHFRGGAILMSAISGIDQALWDIKGKHYGTPVYELMGGAVKDQVETYQWIGGDEASEIAAAAARAKENGYNTIKIVPISRMKYIEDPSVLDDASEALKITREHVGDEIDIAVDLRGRVSQSMLKPIMERLDRYDPMFYEDPLRPEYVDHLYRLKQYTRTPFASGEQLYTRWQYRTVLSDRSVDLIQPNPSHSGGLTETHRISTMAEAYDIGIFLHCPLGPISFASGLQVATATQNVHMLSQHLDIHAPTNNDRLAYLDDPGCFEFDDGFVTAPEKPGLGISIDEEYVQERAEEDVNWQMPLWYHDDGSLAEW